jgi:hypothetical protein
MKNRRNNGERRINPLNDKWVKIYKSQDNVVISAMRGYDWRRNWLGAWNLMYDFQNTEVCKLGVII